MAAPAASAVGWPRILRNPLDASLRDCDPCASRVSVENLAPSPPGHIGLGGFNQAKFACFEHRSDSAGKPILIPKEAANHRKRKITAKQLVQRLKLW
jgi:hypothetical protein